MHHAYSEMCLGETPLAGAGPRGHYVGGTFGSAALQHFAGRGRSGTGAWRGGTGAVPSVAGDEIVLHNWSACTRGPRGCVAGEFHTSASSMIC